MIRTQVQLTEAQHRSLRALASQRGVSLAALVRWCIDEALAAETPSRSALYDRAQQLVGSLHDREGATDLSGDHDRYLEEAFE